MVTSHDHLHRSCIFQSPQAVWHHTHSSLPAPRYAHQFIYDHVHKVWLRLSGSAVSDSAAPLCAH